MFLILVRDPTTNQIHIEVMRTQYFLRKHLYKRSLSSLTRSLPSFTLSLAYLTTHSLFLSVLLAAWHRICKSFWPCTLVHRWAGLILVRGGGSRWWSTASSRTKSHQSGSQSSRDWQCRRLVNRMSSYSIWRLKKSFEALVILFSLKI